MSSNAGEKLKKSLEAVEKLNAKTKKKPRIRDRARNKRNRITVNGSPFVDTTTILQSVQSKSVQNENSVEKNMSAPNEMPSNEPQHTASVTAVNAAQKSREEIMAEREAKKLAKQAKKSKVKTTDSATAATTTVVPTEALKVTQECNPIEHAVNVAQKSREEIMSEREAKKLAKQMKKSKTPMTTVEATTTSASADAAEKLQNQVQNLSMKPAAELTQEKPKLSKAERRAIQEAQRAAKATALSGKTSEKIDKLTKTAVKIVDKPKDTIATTTISMSTQSKSDSNSQAKVFWNDSCQVKLFNHLETRKKYDNVHVNHANIHASIIALGEKYAKRTVVGSNARCIGFLHALKTMITDFVTPPKKEFSRSLEVSITKCVEYLQSCRPLAVSVYNAFKHIKHVLTQFPADKPESELKENLCHFIDTYIENQIEKAAQAISSSMQEKILDGDVILTFGCSSLINFICEEAHRRHVNFRVIIVDSRPFCEGKELLRRLTAHNIPCTYVLINALSFVMPGATKVLLGAHALLSNGYVMARTGTAQVSLVARSFNVPVLVCCETHKFSERFQTDAIVYNELGNPDDLILSDKCCLSNWQAKHKMSPLNLIYDITPPELVTAVVTEVSILPCTSVPVILRIKPAEIGYYC